MLGESDGSGVHVWFPWSGALFTHFFAQCFIDYAAMGADNPGAHGVPHRPRVDWWENARRGVQLHRAKALRNPLGVPTLGVNAWGLSACDSAGGYAVPGVFPARIPTLDQVPQIDFADFTPKDDFGDGTIAPYAAGCSLLFEPEAAIAALRYYRGLAGSDGRPLVWRELGGGGGGGEGGGGERRRRWERLPGLLQPWYQLGRPRLRGDRPRATGPGDRKRSERLGLAVVHA